MRTYWLWRNSAMHNLQRNHVDAKPKQLHIGEDGSSFYTFKTRNQNISFDTTPCIIWDAQLSRFTCRSSLFPLDWNPQRLILHPIYPIHLQLILYSCLTEKHFDIFRKDGHHHKVWGLEDVHVPHRHHCHFIGGAFNDHDQPAWTLYQISDTGPLLLSPLES